MLPDRVSNPGPLTYESGSLPIALRGPANMMLHTKFQGHWSIGSGDEDFIRILPYMWVWQPCWSCDLEYLHNVSFLKCLEAVCEIWLQSAQQFQRRSGLKLWTDERTMDGRRSLPIL